MPNKKNIESVRALTEKIKNAKSVVFMDYRGSSANSTSTARKAVKGGNDLEYVIAKNRLFKLALKNAGLENAETESVLRGPTSFILSYKEAELAPKITKEFAKNSGFFKIKGGILEGRAVTAAEVSAIANLPSKEVLIAQLVAQLNAPIQGLHTVLNANITKLAQVLKSVNDKRS